MNKINDNIKTKVVHSKSKPAFNVVNESLGGKYKIARVPYVLSDDDNVTAQQRKEALAYAEFISYCLNHSNEIKKL